MMWQSHEHQVTPALDEPMVEELGTYLEIKEAQLSKQIFQLVSVIEGIPALAIPESSTAQSLNDAVEAFSKKIRKAGQAQRGVLAGDDLWKLGIKRLNESLWEYIEVLEGCVTELFQQLAQIGFEHWDIELTRAMTSIKDELTHRIDDVTWTIRRLEDQLTAYQRSCESRQEKWMLWRKIPFFRKRLLDSQLEPALRKCNKFLGFRYRKFVETYQGYLQLYDSVQKQLQKFYNYRILSSLDLDQQDKYKHLFMLLQLWQQNHESRVLPQTETLRALRSFGSYPIIASFFKEYLRTMRKAVFDKSRMIKKQFNILFVDKDIRQPLLDNLNDYRAELATLSDTIHIYLKFLQHTDPKTKSTFFGLAKNDRKQSEADRFGALHTFLQDCRELDLLIVNFHSSLECDPSSEKKLTPDVQAEIDRNLHEMEQPLASQELIRRDSKALLHILHGLDEMGSFDQAVVNVVRTSLIKAMCSDWKYHVLQDLPLFHHVYKLHQDICADGDRAHMGRLGKFEHILGQLDQWIVNKETIKHNHDIEYDINDIKAYLQDYLAHVQRLEKRPPNLLQSEIIEHPVTKAEQALLEYLYVFGQFFHKLRHNDPEHRLIRKQLLFVDQYFEEIQRKLHELGIN